MATGHVEYFPPTRPHAESRGHALRRIVLAGHLDEGPEPLDADLISAMGGNRRIAGRAGVVALAAGAVGALAGLVLSRIPGPFEVSSTAGTAGYVIVLGIALALIATLVGTLVMLEREDGHMEDLVEDYA